MTRYQLSKLVSWADTLHTRKRLQKVVFMLQAAGCPLGADFILHHYGPYSEELARLTDEMVRAALLEEQTSENGVGQQYSYKLRPQAQEKLRSLEQSERGRPLSAQMVRFEPLARVLLSADLPDLEVAATVLYFRRQNHDWPEAIEKTRTFKGISVNNPLLAQAEQLARRVEETSAELAA